MQNAYLHRLHLGVLRIPFMTIGFLVGDERYRHPDPFHAIPKVGMLKVLANAFLFEGLNEA